MDVFLDAVSLEASVALFEDFPPFEAKYAELVVSSVFSSFVLFFGFTGVDFLGFGLTSSSSSSSSETTLRPLAFFGRVSLA